jgi:hypothetical protein
MRLLIVYSLLLTITACGSGGGSSGGSGGTNPPGAGLTTSIQAFTASRLMNNGVSTPGTATATKTTIVTLPALSDFAIQANASDAYHVTLDAGTVSCDYIHNLNAGGLSAGSGCTTANPTVTLTAGQTVVLTIQANNQTNNTTVTLNLTLQQ